jgi:hypothetical protein
MPRLRARIRAIPIVRSARGSTNRDAENGEWKGATGPPYRLWPLWNWLFAI